MDMAHGCCSALHQDQVVVPPSDARIVARSAFTPYAGLDYGDAISFQFHPEFSPGVAIALIEAERHRYGGLAESAIASHAQPDDRARVAQWIGRLVGGGVHDQASPVSANPG
jgi:hypothetical protein